MVEKIYRRPYQPARYESLINSLRQSNKYAYAALFQGPPALTGRRAKVIKLPEGYLLLARTPHVHAPGLTNLRDKPLALRYFILTFDHSRNRIRLQASKRFWRQKLAYVNEVCSSKYWRRAPEKIEKTVEAMFTTINSLTREMWEIDRHAFVYPGMRRAWDRKVRKLVVTWLTSVAKMKAKEANRLARKSLSTWYRWRNRKRAWKKGECLGKGKIVTAKPIS